MATTKMMTGNDIRALREGLDLSTVQFGKLLGLGPSAVTRWEAKKGKPVRMDPFAERVAEIVMAQSKRLGKTKFGEIVNAALSHEHDLFALWRILSLAFGETVKVVRKITKGGKGKRDAKKDAKKTVVRRGRRAKRELKTSGRRTARRTTKRARRVARKASKPATASKAKRAPRAKAALPPGGESKITPSPAKDRVEAAGTNGVTPQ